jgi:hypothetical protein
MSNRKTKTDTATVVASARKYVNKQLEIMRRYGAAPKNLTPEAYEALVQKVVAASS